MVRIFCKKKGGRDTQGEEHRGFWFSWFLHKTQPNPGGLYTTLYAVLLSEFLSLFAKRYLLTERLLLEERFSVPQPGTELCPVQCKCRVLITGLPENSITERILINIPSIKRSYEGMNYKHQDGEEKREKLEDFVDCFSLPPPHPHLLYVLYTVNFFN